MEQVKAFDPNTQTLLETTHKNLQKSFLKPPEDSNGLNVVYKVVCPGDLNLKDPRKPTKVKSGRPKRCKSDLIVVENPASPVEKKKDKPLSKTRSGREVKVPKHIQKDFKKIIIDDNPLANDDSFETTDFEISTSSDNKPPPVETETLKETVQVQKKRKIAAQYRCPKCKKAYLGRSKILEHLKKNPSHGPMHQSEENHFELWNYLVAITQKCAASEKGRKFCQEVSNLLHNLLLLTNALFKKVGSCDNEVNVDKVLGNAMGLAPGVYYFDDNNLYKDVTVLQLMSNSDFLNAIRFKNSDSDNEEKECKCNKMSMIDKLVLKSMEVPKPPSPPPLPQLPEPHVDITKQMDNMDLDNNKIDKKAPDEEKTLPYFDYDIKPHTYFSDFNFNEPEKPKEKSPNIIIQSNVLICPANPKHQPQSSLPSKVNSELLIENSVMVDELMLPVSASETSAILDNSSSSDDLMNVDQFVNERFRKITESDLEVGSSNSLHLDLPALELFQFHNN